MDKTPSKAEEGVDSTGSRPPNWTCKCWMEEEHAKKGAFEDSSVNALSPLNRLQEETATVRVDTS